MRPPAANMMRWDYKTYSLDINHHCILLYFVDARIISKLMVNDSHNTVSKRRLTSIVTAIQLPIVWFVVHSNLLLP